MRGVRPETVRRDERGYALPGAQVPLMLRRLRREQSGAALGLVVILVVLYWGEAARFLALVRGDPEAVSSSNHGQRRFALADAGAQAAGGQLRSAAAPERHDASEPDNVGLIPRLTGLGRPWQGPDLGGRSATATARYLIPATEEGQLAGENHAPELVPAGSTDYPDRNYFLVASEGVYGGRGARSR